MVELAASCAWGRVWPSRPRTQGPKCARSGTRGSEDEGMRSATGVIQACEVAGSPIYDFGREPARLTARVPGSGLRERLRRFFAGALPEPLALFDAFFPALAASAPLAPSAFSAAFAAFAFSRSSRFWRISTIEGQSSLRQSFQGRPRNPLTVSLGISSQIEQRSSRRQRS